MADQEQVRILKSSVEAWNRWRGNHPQTRIDLRDADFSEADLSGAHLNGADLNGADLGYADLNGADLNGAHLSGAHLSGAHLSGADLGGGHLSNADLNGADLSGANLGCADLSGAHLNGARLNETNLGCANLSDSVLQRAVLVQANLAKAKLNNSHIYGISAWNVNLEGAEQSNLIITPDDAPAIRVDNLQIAQFIYLLLNNPEIQGAIDITASKVVLILGRFAEARQAIVDALREELRQRHYIPVVFDFDVPAPESPGRWEPRNRRPASFSQTVATLARMARFVIADITDPRVVLPELRRIVKDLPSVPVQPLLLHGANTSLVLTDFLDYPSFLNLHLYQDTKDLLGSLADKVIAPAQARADEIKKRRQRAEEAISR